MTDTEVKQLVEFIWQLATDPTPDLTGMGRKQIAVNNVRFQVNKKIAAERQRLLDIVKAERDYWTGALITEDRLNTLLEKMEK